MNETLYRIHIQSDPDASRVHDLTGTSLTVGRYPLADIVIDDSDVTYRHALLTRGEVSYRIADLGSDAGTYVNGQRIGADPVALSPGDVILFGTRVSAAFMAVVDVSGAPPLEEAIVSDPASEGADEELPDMSAAELPEQTTPGVVSEYEPPVWEEPESVEPLATAESSAARASTHAGPLPAMPPPQKNKTGRIALIAAGCLVLLLACCCSATLFMYFIGGDWLLNQISYVP